MTMLSDALAITNEFTNQFGALYPNVPIAHDNVAFARPTGAWVRLSVSPNGGPAASVGRGHYRDTGVAFVQIFTALEGGSADALTIAQDVVEIFRGQRLGGLMFVDPLVARIGPDETHYQINVQIPYRSDKFVTV